MDPVNIARLAVGIVAVLAGLAMVIFCRPVGRWYSRAIRAFAGSKDASAGPAGMAVMVVVVGVAFVGIGAYNIVQTPSATTFRPPVPEDMGGVSAVFIALLVLGAAWLIGGVLVLLRRAPITRRIQRRYDRVNGSHEQAPTGIAVGVMGVVSVAAGAAALLIGFLVLR